MEKMIIVSTKLADHDRIMGLIRTHAKGFIRVVHHKEHNDIVFAVARRNFKKCKDDLNLAKTLGFEIIIETEF